MMLKWKNYILLCPKYYSCLTRVNFSVSAKKASVEKKLNCDFSNTKKDTIIDKPVKKKHRSHKTRLSNHFNSNDNWLGLRSLLPDECLIEKKNPEYIYLIDPSIAKKVAYYVLSILQEKVDQVVAESTPGLGHISEELLQNEVHSVRLYEPHPMFRDQLKKISDRYPGRTKLFTKDLFSIPKYYFLDKTDNGNRIEQLLDGIPKKCWTSDPVMTIIGTTVNSAFLRHLAFALPLQTSLAIYGRVQMFLMMKPVDYLVLTGNASPNLMGCRYIAILFNLFFDYEIVDKFPRIAFLPWEGERKYVRKPRLRRIDEDKIYLTRIVWKKDLPLPSDQMVPFYFFVKQFFKPRSKIIPTLENWVSGCGEALIWPKHNHHSYFENISIHTEFGELTPMQILGVFKEMYQHPSYSSSPFLGMVEAALIKTETIETKINEVSQDLEKNIIEDIRVDS